MAAEARLDAAGAESSGAGPVGQPEGAKADDHALPLSDYEPSNEDGEDSSDEDDGYRMVSQHV